MCIFVNFPSVHQQFDDLNSIRLFVYSNIIESFITCQTLWLFLCVFLEQRRKLKQIFTIFTHRNSFSLQRKQTTIHFPHFLVDISDYTFSLYLYFRNCFHIKSRNMHRHESDRKTHTQTQAFAVKFLCIYVHGRTKLW